ncbi:hypothetical protein XH99_12860 [Bradyrhizobium nanningense]|uniref:Uncharacterized protein n=1 Tax=Bradyrhizobium nanningense TaxID=1325118 RepID=A0A4Q0S6S6_9BRAD|nr:hypothetical protein XH99_12860 [Bradyrhizobium nanningense]
MPDWDAPISRVLLWKFIPLAQQVGIALISQSVGTRLPGRSMEHQTNLFNRRDPILVGARHEGMVHATQCGAIFMS